MHVISARENKGIRDRLFDQPFFGYFTGLMNAFSNELSLVGLISCVRLCFLAFFFFEKILFGSGSTMLLSRPDFTYFSTLQSEINTRKQRENRGIDTSRIFCTSSCKIHVWFTFLRIVPSF